MSIPLTEERSIHKISFTGNTADYFGIWIVNILLTALTLGFYSPWAKVRRERYFHENSHLDGSSFEYVADPWKIFKGRILVAATVLIYVVVNAVFPPISVLFIVIYLGAFPWIVTQSLKFRARYTKYRNISFKFSGTYIRTTNHYILLPLLGVLSLGLAFPWSKYLQRRYLVNNLSFGSNRFSFNAPLMGFYLTYLAFGIFAIVPILFFLARQFIAIFAMSMDNGDTTTGTTGTILRFMESGNFLVIITFLLLIVLSIAPLLIKSSLLKLTWNRAKVGPFSVRTNFTVLGLFWVYISNLLLRVITLGLASPYCQIRVRRHILQNIALVGSGSLSDFTAGQKEGVGSIGDQAAEIYDMDIDLGF